MFQRWGINMFLLNLLWVSKFSQKIPSHFEGMSNIWISRDLNISKKWNAHPRHHPPPPFPHPMLHCFSVFCSSFVTKFSVTFRSKIDSKAHLLKSDEWSFSFDIGLNLAIGIPNSRWKNSEMKGITGTK